MPASSVAQIQFTNQTDSPIDVYLDGQYKGHCESGGKLRVAEPRSGKLILLGRWRCDRWGPSLLRVRRGAIATHAFTEVDRVVRR
jgi:hypothetical protein